ncbi:CidA/LrgA family protein [Paracoccus albus]|uniref:CidA/LrgA family protein n=1 Tax=Paracoccus albus TaxID=3017784 RepID=UPI0022F112EE|nr:CidA/LrgA family protein [Paracoccus albus]WBU61577.1 CidA/LrgA family protein [Paracoccus albus]
MISALTIILSFQLIGEVASRGLGLPLPGPVIGLVLLVIASSTWAGFAEKIRAVAQGVLGHLSLFFVPAGVGVVAHLPTLSQHGAGLAIAIIVSTLLAIAAGALAFVLVARLSGASDE